MDYYLLTTNYFAPIQYYAKLASGTPIIIEQNDNYVKQTYRNRCIIGSANGPLTLTIPVEKPEGAAEKVLTRDMRISDHGNWRKLHWNAIESAYNSTPFFEYYKDDFLPFFERKYGFLFDFNEELRRLVCKLIDIQPLVNYSTHYHMEASNNSILDFRELIHPKRLPQDFDPSFNVISYYQVFTTKFGFQPNLSIIDLLFNMGPESLIILRKSY